MEGKIVQDKPAELQNQPARPWLKIALFSVLGLVLLGGIALAAIQIGKKQPSQIAIQPTPTLAPIAIPTFQPAPSPSSAETINWKSYTNIKYGYSFKYPPSWFLQKMPEEGGGGVDMLFSYRPPELQIKDPNFWKGKLSINIGKMVNPPKKTTQTLKQWLQEYESLLDRGETYRKIAEETTSIDGRGVIKVTSGETTDRDKVNIIYYIDKGNNIYFISAGQDFNSENKSKFEQFLSTFKFLD